MPYRVLVRTGPRVERLRAQSLAGALELVEQRARALSAGPPLPPVDLKLKTFEPVQQVAARVELAGPQRLRPAIRAGVDVRGDGAVEAWTGRVGRTLVEQQQGETPYAALRRVLQSTSVAP